MKDFWSWLMRRRDEEEMRRLEREGADIDVVYGLRPSYMYFAGVLYSLLMILLDVVISKDAMLSLHSAFLVGCLIASAFSHVMETKWSWRRTGLVGLVVGVATGILTGYALELVF